LKNITYHHITDKHLFNKSKSEELEHFCLSRIVIVTLTSAIFDEKANVYKIEKKKKRERGN
jgi:hypothetical protein